MSSLTAATPMLPKGTAAALAFATTATPAASFSQRLADRYLGDGSPLPGLQVAPGRGLLAPELAWVFPRAWYLDHLASRHLAVPRWYHHEFSRDPSARDEGALTREAMEMPVVGVGRLATAELAQTQAQAAAAATFAPGVDEPARVWAANFEASPPQLSSRASAARAGGGGLPAVAASASHPAVARREPWLPPAVSAMATRAPLGLVHLAWSDAILSQMVGTPSVATPPPPPPPPQPQPQAQARTPRDAFELPLVARPPQALRRDVAGVPEVVRVESPQRTPIFADDEEVSDDVFAAIARPRGDARPRLAPPVARDARTGDGGQQAAPPPAFGNLFAASMAAVVRGASDAPMSVRIRLADAQAAHVAPHWFSSGEVDGLALGRAETPRHREMLRGEAGPRRQAPPMPPLAVAPAIASSTPRTRRAMSHNVEAQALGAAAIAENGNVVTTWPAALTAPVADSSAANVYARHAPGARGYAAALQATELALGVAYLSMQFVTPGEAAVARAMQLAPALWTSGVTLAAAGDDAVAARWSALEQMALVSPGRAPAPGPSPRLPRGVYAWPVAATAGWQRAEVADGVAGDDQQTQPELRRAFAAVWGEAALRERMAAHPPAGAAELGAPPGDDVGRARALPLDVPRASRVGSAAAPGAAPLASSASPPSAMPLLQATRRAPAPHAGMGAAAPAAAAMDAMLKSWPAQLALSQSSQPSQASAYAGDAASRMLVALTAGVSRDALPASVLAWVSQLEVAVANEQRAARLPPPASGMSAPGMPALALAGARHAAEAVPATAQFEHARETPQLTRAEQVAELADLRRTYVVAGPTSGQAGRRGADSLRAEISSLRPSEFAALMQAAGQAPAGSGGAATTTVFGGASVALPAQWSDGAAASLAAGMAPTLAGETTQAEPSLYEMTMIAALGQAAPAALAARASHEPAPAHRDAPGPAPVPLDVEAEAQAVLREVLHLIHALRDRNGDF